MRMRMNKINKRQRLARNIISGKKVGLMERERWKIKP